MFKVHFPEKICEVSLQIIFEDYLREHGVTQHFYSPHGPNFDDKYSYLHGVNLLMFEGRSRAHTIYVIRKLMEIIVTQKTSGTRKDRRARLLDQKEYSVPVDQPRLGILTPSPNLDSDWVSRVRSEKESVTISDDLRTLLPDIAQTNFVEYSLSRNYAYSLIDYIPCFQQVLNLI
ncbi:MAG: hypothetical protein ACFFE8_14025 [Candidatus Heimdallarchaeota archaeon]